MDKDDDRYLGRCVELAEAALEAGHSPYGSVLVGRDGAILFEDHNRSGDGDATRHPEFEIARWAARNLPVEERRTARVYTSGEHCPMCSAAHGWVGLGPIAFASSAAQAAGWRREAGAAPSPVAAIPIGEMVPGLEARGPFPAFEAPIAALHRRFHARQRP
jgi:tRNA(Arg) A34 adenosine deaminase TadA